MKRTVFGVFLMAVGMALLITGTTLFTVSAQSGNNEEYEEYKEYEPIRQENCVYVGEYYKDGDITLDKVTISDSEIILADGTAAEYTLSVWKNMPETDERSGRITYKDYCFLKLAEGKLSYDPLEKEVVIEGIAYRMP